MDKKQEDILFDAYEQWRIHPITKQLVENIKKHRQSFVESISTSATNTAVSDSSIRLLTIGIRDMDTVLSIILNYETFKKLVEK